MTWQRTSSWTGSLTEAFTSKYLVARIAQLSSGCLSKRALQSWSPGANPTEILI